jgi:acyl carrier protein
MFIYAYFSEMLSELGLGPEDFPDSFDLFEEGIIDSLGIFDLVEALEKEYGVEIDIENFDIEEITVVGSLARQVGQILDKN